MKLKNGWRKGGFVLLFVIVSGLEARESKAQDPDADSLFLPVLKTEPESSRFQKSYELCIRFMMDWRGKRTAERATPYAERILQQAEKKKDEGWVARSQLALAALHFLKANDKSALSLVEKAEPVFRKRKDYQALSELLYLKGHLYRDIQQYDKMEAFWNEGINLSRQHKLYNQLQALLGTLATDLTGIKEFAKAEPLYFESLRLPQSARDLARSYSDVSIFYAQSQRLEKAHLYADSAMEIAERHNLKDLFGIFYFNQACMALDEGKLDEAERLGLLSLDLASGEGRLDHRVKTFQFLKDVSLKKRNFEKAFSYGEKFYQLQDTLKETQRQMDLRDLDKKYQTALKEKTIQEQKQLIAKKEQQRQMLLIGLGLLLLISVLGGGVFYLNRKRKESRLLQARMESELKALRAQMNPHFMFNSLNAIQQMVLNNENMEAFRYLDTYSKLTRQILENSEKSWIPVKEEIRFLELYLQMESLRFDHAFQWKIEVDESVSTHSDQIPAMLIQPLVENAIKHGLLPKAGEKMVAIRFSRPDENGPLFVEVEDNGVGRKAASEKMGQTDHHSMSLSITENRLQLLGGGKTSRLEMEDLKNPQGQPAGTRVRFSVAT